MFRIRIPIETSKWCDIYSIDYTCKLHFFYFEFEEQQVRYKVWIYFVEDNIHSIWFFWAKNINKFLKIANFKENDSVD